MKYGVTWATADHSTAQTGYVYDTIQEAKSAALAGPVRAEADTQVDGMCEHDDHPYETLYGLVQTEDDTIVEVEVDTEPSAAQLEAMNNPDSGPSVAHYRESMRDAGRGYLLRD